MDHSIESNESVEAATSAGPDAGPEVSRTISIDTECTVNFGDFCDMAVFAWASSDSEFGDLAVNDIYIKSSNPTKRIRSFVKFDMERLASAPTMSEVYGVVRSVLEDKGAALFAYGAESDVHYICSKIDLSKLERVDFRIYDVCSILRKYCTDKDIHLPNYQLGTVCSFWDIPITAHQASSDAVACLSVVRHICETEGISIGKLIEMYGEGNLCTSKKVYRRMDVRKMKTFVQREACKSNGRELGAVSKILLESDGHIKLIRRGI